MQALEFNGCDRLIGMLSAAVALDDNKATTDAIRKGLSDMIARGDFRLPDCVYVPVSDHYARRELYRCDQMGFSVVAMTWGPGQGTPIHDHSGLWCVEGVLEGQIEVVQYALKERDGKRWRFEAAGTQIAGPASAGSLIPPHEYHTIKNISDTDTAISLHIYKAELKNCSMFTAVGDDWYECCEKKLCLDTTQ